MQPPTSGNDVIDGKVEKRDGVWDRREILHRQWSHDSSGWLGDVQERTDHVHW